LINALTKSSYLAKGTGEAVRALGTGWITNYAEGKMMGIQTFDDTIKQAQSEYFQSIVSDLKKANPEVPEVVEPLNGILTEIKVPPVL